MKVVGEDDLAQADFERYLAAEFLDSVFMQQNAFSDADSSPSNERTALLLKLTAQVVDHDFGFRSKDQARETFTELTATVRDWNLAAEGSEDYRTLLEKVHSRLNASAAARAA